jgi:hypothetical protein
VTVLINPFLDTGISLLTAVQSAGLSSGLKLCLDVGDATSYPGSGAQWLDTSGQAVHFNRNTPTFNGAAGALSSANYWSFNGSTDVFHLTAASNPAWIEPFHKNGATFSLAWAVYPSAKVETLIGDSGQPGWALSKLATGEYIISVLNGAGISVLSHTSTAKASHGAWNVCGLSIDENGGAAGGIHFTNGTAETFNPSYASPAATSAGALLEVCSRGGTSTDNAFDTTTRFAWIAVWDTALTSANFASLFTQTRGRFGI